MSDAERSTETVASPRLLSVSETAQALGVKERFVWSLLSTGVLTSLKLGRRRLIDVRDLERFIETNKEVRR